MKNTKSLYRKLFSHKLWVKIAISILLYRRNVIIGLWILYISICIGILYTLFVTQKVQNVAASTMSLLFLIVMLHGVMLAYLCILYSKGKILTNLRQVERDFNEDEKKIFSERDKWTLITTSVCLANGIDYSVMKKHQIKMFINQYFETLNASYEQSTGKKMNIKNKEQFINQVSTDLFHVAKLEVQLDNSIQNHTHLN